jgi:hypothetical protein
MRLEHEVECQKVPEACSRQESRAIRALGGHPPQLFDEADDNGRLGEMTSSLQSSGAQAFASISVKVFPQSPALALNVWGDLVFQRLADPATIKIPHSSAASGWSRNSRTTRARPLFSCLRRAVNRAEYNRIRRIL